jgi:hypothetical protein
MRKKTKTNDSARKRAEEMDPPRKNMARSLFFLNAILWLIYVVYIYFDMAVVHNNKSSADLVTIFVFVNAVAQLISGIIFGRQKLQSYYFPLVVVLLNIILTLLNIVDLFFTLMFIINLLIIWTILPLRKNYPLNP